MFVSDDSALAERVRRLKFHGLGVDAYDRLSHGRKPQAEVIEPGFKYNLADLNAALALVQLKRLDALNARRQASPNATWSASPACRWRRSACPRTSSATPGTCSSCASTPRPAAWAATPSWKP